MRQTIDTTVKIMFKNELTLVITSASHHRHVDVQVEAVLGLIAQQRHQPPQRLMPRLGHLPVGGGSIRGPHCGQHIRRYCLRTDGAGGGGRSYAPPMRGRHRGHKAQAPGRRGRIWDAQVRLHQRKLRRVVIGSSF